LGFRFGRSHRLLGLTKRDRRALVTNTFVNGHVVLLSASSRRSRSRDARVYALLDKPISRDD
ncbi:MAG TPA: hypothetical protein VE801_17385, partial [Xanthobacteraceae bacterium]|nr:hypothetical protein [Xanthobacteraceae bacterium]